jgi:hypothetical protein
VVGVTVGEGGCHKSLPRIISTEYNQSIGASKRGEERRKEKKDRIKTFFFPKLYFFEKVLDF